MRWIVFVLMGVLAGLVAQTTRVDQERDEAGAVAAQRAEQARFRWVVVSDGVLDLLDDDTPMLRYMYAYDASTPERAHATYKCYHHVFDGEGKGLLTKGPGGLYTHHRGIFIGWNRLAVDGKEYDFWHMKAGTQRHAGTLELSAGEGRARQAVRIHWCDDDGRIILTERRELTIHAADERTILLVDFRSDLTPQVGDVLLNGDPEHAGVQFRAHNDVADGPAEVKARYQFHDDGANPRTDVDLLWAAMSFGLNGKRYLVQHMNHPGNLSPTVYSAYRDYGRFGAFPTAEIKLGETLTLRYRIWIGEGDLPSRDSCAERYRAYVEETAGSAAGKEQADEGAITASD